jgi:hypothetical protein
MEMASYTLEDREKVLADIAAGATIRGTARRYGITAVTVRSWIAGKGTRRMALAGQPASPLVRDPAPPMPIADTGRALLPSRTVPTGPGKVDSLEPFAGLARAALVAALSDPTRSIRAACEILDRLGETRRAAELRIAMERVGPATAEAQAPVDVDAMPEDEARELYARLAGQQPGAVQ